MISSTDNIARKKRKVFGPLGRFLLKVFNWKIEGEIPNLKKMILIGLPHTAMRDAWYALLAVWALDLKINFFGAAWVFTRLPSLFTISKNLDRLGVPWPFWWVQKYLMLKLGGIPVYRTNSKGLIHAAVEEFKKIDSYVLVIAPEAGTEPVTKFRSGFYFLAKGLNVPYVPIEIDFKNRRFKIHQYKFVEGSFEEESDKIIDLFKGVQGATRKFKMLQEKE
ncbi:MAG: hypothetical protein CL496_01440 [Actinobacteria bacterium]|jgi:1-acyl-sn-glycerol-3-phosphate acyltransferase|nr:hypothetical protein [Actinomycetota bacterium]|tara:strand:+ start:9277 stop:9939 length:663 start_codon:yes stop_codon:yes gene_type:complete